MDQSLSLECPPLGHMASHPYNNGLPPGSALGRVSSTVLSWSPSGIVSLVPFPRLKDGIFPFSELRFGGGGKFFAEFAFAFKFL